MRKTILLIPGWHEKAHDLRTITHGRPPLPGLAARGFDPRTFELQPDESLPERIDRFAEYIRDLKNREPERFPLALFGYSMGGIVARGLLYRHPELVPDISHIALLATPNWGLPMADIPALARIVGLPWRELYNIDPEREFVPTLNSCRGAWSELDGTRVWIPDREPWIAPPSVKLLAIAGMVPRFGDGDGLVTVDSATMGGRIPSITITDRHANHLNVTGETDTIATIVRGFRRSDGVWPKVLDAFCDFVGGSESTPSATAYEESLTLIAH